MELFLTGLIGFLGGVVSGLFGVGGGLIFVPLLILVKKVSPHDAVGTSLAAIVPTAFVAMLNYSGSSKVLWKAALLVAVFAMCGAWVGSKISLGLDSLTLRRLLAVFLVVLAVKMCFSK